MSLKNKANSDMHDVESPHYISKIQQRHLTDSPVEHRLAKALVADDVEEKEAELTAKPSLLWLKTLGVGLFTWLSFTLYQGGHSLWLMKAENPIGAGLLAGLLLIFILMLITLVYREIKGFKAINVLTEHHQSLVSLKQQNNLKQTHYYLKQRQALQSQSPFAQAIFKQFNQSLKPHHTNEEVLSLYQTLVLDALHQQAKKVLKKESMLSAGLAFISPNSLIQSIMVFWVSLRTLKRIALVYGVRPGFAGSLRLVRMTLENLAAQNVTEVMSDTIGQQIGGGIAGKLVEQSTEAVAASALNMRLGKALIRLLQAH